jgi:hypothetical protein
MVTAARKYHRIVQTGTQHRSAPHYQEVQRIIQSGELGEVRYVRVWNFVNMFPYGIGHVPDSDRPKDWIGIFILVRRRRSRSTKAASCATSAGSGITPEAGLPISARIGSIRCNK